MKKHVVNAFHYTETQEMLDVLEKNGIETSSCYVCGTLIVKTERSPHFLKEKWDSWRHGKIFYNWNISGISNKGVLCDSIRCLWDAIHKKSEICEYSDKETP